MPLSAKLMWLYLFSGNKALVWIEGNSFWNRLPSASLLLMVMSGGMPGFENLSALVTRLFNTWRNWE